MNAIVADNNLFWTVDADNTANVDKAYSKCLHRVAFCSIVNEGNTLSGMSSYDFSNTSYSSGNHFVQ